MYTSRFVLMSTPGRVRRDAYNIKYNVSVYYYYVRCARIYTRKPEKFLHIRVPSQFTRHFVVVVAAVYVYTQIQ